MLLQSVTFLPSQEALKINVARKCIAQRKSSLHIEFCSTELSLQLSPNVSYSFVSINRSCRIYSIQTKNCIHNISKMSLHPSNGVNGEKAKSFRMFHDDTMRSFFRRLTFTPDGTFLIVPAGCIEHKDGKVQNTSYVFTRANISK